MEHPRRKSIRLKGYDYDTPGYYFITVCTHEKEKILCEIEESCRDYPPGQSDVKSAKESINNVGTAVPYGPSPMPHVRSSAPEIRLTAYGLIVEKHLRTMCDFYDDLKVEKYVIMPNHIHLLIHILDRACEPMPINDPRDRRPRQSVTNSRISGFVGTFKRFCNREIGRNIWQYRSHDHIIRGERDYSRIWEYIDNNPAKWADDCFYTP